MSKTVVPTSKANTTNPKDLVGSTKVSLTKFPAVAVLHGAHAMMDGARKYGPYNWRDKEVQAHIYVDAALRHIMAWFEGEELAEDSSVHHLGHAIACCAILLDAQATGKLIDDRPVNDHSFGVLQTVMKELQVKIQAKLAAIQAQNGFEISVNGNKVVTKKASLDYKDVCELAGNDPTILHTVTWKCPDGRAGCLIEPDIITTCPGLIVNCMFTGNA
jgi:hypothetical protein